MVTMETGHFLKMLNDDSLASLGFLMWEVLGCIICKKNIVGTLVQGWTKNPCLAAGLPVPNTVSEWIAWTDQHSS